MRKPAPAWAHFDLFGAGNRFAHGGEVIQNELTLGSTSQVDVYRGLVRRHEDTVPNMPPSDFDLSRTIHEYAAAAYSPSAILVPVVDRSPFPFALSQSIEFSVSALLRQDETYLSSRSPASPPPFARPGLSRSGTPGDVALRTL